MHKIKSLSQFKSTLNFFTERQEDIENLIRLVISRLIARVKIDSTVEGYILRDNPDLYLDYTEEALSLLPRFRDLRPSRVAEIVHEYLSIYYTWISCKYKSDSRDLLYFSTESIFEIGSFDPMWDKLYEGLTIELEDFIQRLIYLNRKSVQIRANRAISLIKLSSLLDGAEGFEAKIVEDQDGQNFLKISWQ